MTNLSTFASASPNAPDWKALFPEPVAVLGYGVEGRSTLNHLLRRGYRDIVVLDVKAPEEPLPDGVRGVFGSDYLGGLEANHGVRTAFRAPGLRPFDPKIQAFTARGGLLTSQVEAVFALFDRHRIVGVTGTVGKGTCCSLLSAMLDAAAMPHRLAGNIGLPPLDALDDFAGLPPEALLLLELSSFQLSTVRVSPHVAVVLRTTVEHLDWHADRAEYWDHKANLARYQTTADTLIYFGGSQGSAWIGGLGGGRRVCVVDAAAPDPGPGVAPEDVVTLTPSGLEWPSHHLKLALADSNMTGAFNLENIAAAAAAAITLGVPVKAVREGARAFAPLEHRIEYVKTHQGVRYFNDSYATRPEAALAAVRAFDEPLGLVLGGSEKNVDFGDFAMALKDESHLRAIALIGHTAERLERALRDAGALEGRVYKHCESLSEALDYLKGEIKSGVILLSPACASFGLFANYKERGKAFKKLVNAF